MEYRFGNGYDVHALKDGLRMVLCGIEVDSACGFVAHSDGDVAIHALCDALLGAAALGDIGKHFPDNDAAYSGIDSTILLGKVAEMLHSEGWKIGNADITIALQAPKIGRLVPQMRSRLAEVLDVSPDRISVKATTTEHLGFVGRGEGCEVWATASVFKD